MSLNKVLHVCTRFETVCLFLLLPFGTGCIFLHAYVTLGLTFTISLIYGKSPFSIFEKKSLPLPG